MSTEKPKRRENGQFLPGQSGNPRGGSQPKVPGFKEFRDKHSMDVMVFLFNFMNDESRQDNARINAAKELNDRFHGRAVQSQVNMDIDGSGEDFSGLSAMLQAAKSALIQRAERAESDRKRARVVELQEPEPEPSETPHDAKA